MEDKISWTTSWFYVASVIHLRNNTYNNNISTKIAETLWPTLRGTPWVRVKSCLCLTVAYPGCSFRRWGGCPHGPGCSVLGLLGQFGTEVSQSKSTAAQRIWAGFGTLGQPLRKYLFYYLFKY
jgi:hypothetical protein